MTAADQDTFPRELIATDGHTTCLWHRQWEWCRARLHLLPDCMICGGKCDRRLTAHELCRARLQHGQPTPRLDYLPECGCRACQDKA